MFVPKKQTNHNMDKQEIYGKDNDLPTYFSKQGFCMNSEHAMPNLSGRAKVNEKPCLPRVSCLPSLSVVCIN